MNSIEGLKLVNRIHKRLLDTEKIDGKLIQDLKELRNYAIVDKDPVLVKLIRLTYEHLENFEGFFINIPEDELFDDSQNEEVGVIHEDVKLQIDSLIYLLSLIEDSNNKRN